MVLMRYTDSRDTWHPLDSLHSSQHLPLPRSLFMSLSSQGDSGGPFVCLLEDSWYVIGLTSWSATCENPIATPSVFARVSYFNKWIKDNKKASSNSKPGASSQPPKNPASPENGNPEDNNENQGAVIKPMVCTALLLSQALLQQLI